MMNTYNMNPLTKAEMNLCNRTYHNLKKIPDGAKTMLQIHFQNADEEMAKIEDGISNFYANYETELSTEKIREKILKSLHAKNLKSTKSAYCYLVKLMTAVTNLNEVNFNDDVHWMASLQDYQNIVDAMENGLMDMDDEAMEKDMTEMLDLLSEAIDQTAVLFTDRPSHKELLKTVEEGTLDEVKTKTEDMKQSAVDLAVVLYTLCEKGKLPSLKHLGDTPEVFGATAACLIEMETAAKKHPWTIAKKIMAKAVKALMVLLVSSPFIITVVAVWSCIVSLLEIGLLGCIFAGLLAGGASVIAMKTVDEKMSPVFITDEKVLHPKHDLVTGTILKGYAWVRENVVPKAAEIFGKCREFLVNRVLVPVSVFLMKLKEKTISGYEIITEKIGEGMNNIYDSAERVRDRVKQAYNDSRKEKAPVWTETEDVYNTEMADFEDEYTEDESENEVTEDTAVESEDDEDVTTESEVEDTEDEMTESEEETDNTELVFA